MRKTANRPDTRYELNKRSNPFVEILLIVLTLICGGILAFIIKTSL